MNILQRSMASQGILNDTQTTLADYLMSIAQISVEDAGAIYIELSSIRGNFMENIILRMIENYHFLPDMAQKLKNKQALVESVIANEQQEPSITLSIKDVYDDLVNSKNENEKMPARRGDPAPSGGGHIQYNTRILFSYFSWDLVLAQISHREGAEVETAAAPARMAAMTSALSRSRPPAMTGTCVRALISAMTRGMMPGRISTKSGLPCSS